MSKSASNLSSTTVLSYDKAGKWDLILTNIKMKNLALLECSLTIIL